MGNSRLDMIRATIARAEDGDILYVVGLDGWKVRRHTSIHNEQTVVLTVPVQYVGDDPNNGYVDDYSDLPEPNESGVEEDDSGEYWIYKLGDFLIDFTCWDDSGTRVQISALDAKTAAREYVTDGDFEPSEQTYWVHVQAFPGDEDDDVESFKFPVHPRAPRCTETDHDWRSPHELVGGIKENPGVWGHGGGVKIHEVCAHCGWSKHTDTWATDPADGEQGLTSIRYEEPIHEEVL